MKKATLFFAGIFLLFLSSFAGGIITNTNQSAMYTRMQARDATLGIDATYFNPAGLVHLNNGLHFSINNQTLGQTKTIQSDYQYLNQSEYTGDVSAALFPGIYAVYKMNKLAVSAGFNPIGGGGGATFDAGLPSFEYSPADLVPALITKGQDIRGYSLDAFFEGTSVFFGYQANLSYQINDMISVAIGGRFVSAKETYNGYLKNVQINNGGSWMRATDFFSMAATQYTQAATDLTSAATGLSNAITGGLVNASDPLADATLVGTLNALGLYQEGMTNEQAVAVFSGAASSATVSAAEAGATSILLNDQEADLEKTGTGITPIVSVNIKPSDRLNIALKYEHKTKLELENKTSKDFTTGFTAEGTPVTMFPDGEKARLDIPSQIVAGATFKPIDELMLTGGVHYYLDEQADWNGREEYLDGNMLELALGLEYSLSDKLAVSGGYLFTKSGAGSDYQTDLSYSLPSGTLGLGAAYRLNDILEINIGGSYTMYEEGFKNFDHDLAKSGTLIPVQEKYDKDVWIIAVGLNISLSK